MKSRLLLAIVACLVFSVTVFAEKRVDDSEAVFSSGSRISITGSLTTSSPTYNRVVGSGVDVNCNLNLGQSGVGTDVHYATHCVTVTNFDPIEVVVDAVLTTINDTHMSLYCDPFDAANPTANLVTADDDGGVGLYSAFTLADNITLTPGNQYYLVLTTFGNGDTGDYTIDTSLNVAHCGPVPIEENNWGMIKTRYR